MNVREITEKYLKDNGYDGLCDKDIECACKIGDLIPCCGSYDVSKCEAGHLIKEECNGQYWGWHISTEKPNDDKNMARSL